MEDMLENAGETENKPSGQPARRLGPQSYSPKEPGSVDPRNKLRGT